MSATCPLCHQAVKHPPMVVQFGPDGLPDACAVFEGFGVPVVPPLLSVDFLCDGKPVSEVVAYSRPEGWIWRYQKLPTGEFVLCDGRPVPEKLTGVITLREVAR